VLLSHGLALSLFLLACHLTGVQCATCLQLEEEKEAATLEAMTWALGATSPSNRACRDDPPVSLSGRWVGGCIACSSVVIHISGVPSLHDFKPLETTTPHTDGTRLHAAACNPCSAVWRAWW
jgi:hypothetical protein